MRLVCTRCERTLGQGETECTECGQLGFLGKSCALCSLTNTLAALR